MITAKQLAVLGAAAAVCLIAPLRATGPGDLVLVDVAVTSGAEPVQGLTASDFDVLIDGKPQAVESFTAPPVPLRILLLVDVTASMTTYTDTGDIVEGLTRALVPGDKAAVAGLASRFQMGSQFGSTPREIEAGSRQAFRFEKAERFGPSPVWDALHAALETLETYTGRRGILLVTDGRATGNRIGSQAAIERAVAAGTTIYVLTEARPLIIRQSSDSAARVRPGLMLRELARVTGGIMTPDEQDVDVDTEVYSPKAAIASFVRDLRGMYTLGVSPAGAEAGFHRVEVRVRRPGASLRARSFYRR